MTSIPSLDELVESPTLRRPVRPSVNDPQFQWIYSEPEIRGIVGKVRHRAKQTALAVIDRGWCGFRPLQTHVVICGFTRSGSTLLLLMAEACVANARTFRRECPALAAARFAWRNHPIMITKEPGDVFFIDEILEFYATRGTRVRFILTTRDPRSILTSIAHIEGPDYYRFATPAVWRAFYEHFQYARRRLGTCQVVEYRDLVCRPLEVQRRLTEFVGWDVRLPFDQYQGHVPQDFRTGALNGVRPLDPTRLESWREEKHRDRIRQVLSELPELPECLIEMGYERDTEWAREYI